MKLLHTSDWHVGKLLRGRSRADEHRAVLAEIVAVAGNEPVDLVLVAGDLFDTPAPSPESESIVYRALLALAEVAPVVVVSGNHDNPRRLAAVAPLFEMGRVHVASEVRRPDDGGVLNLEAGGVPVRVATVPFVSQRGIIRAHQLVSPDQLAPDQVSPAYADRLSRVLDALASGFDGSAVELVLGHLFAAGATMGGGERSAHTIFEYSIPATAFGVKPSYVALGHLHRAQNVPAGVPVRYCGSPLQLDFGETGDEKSVTVVEVAPSTPASVREVGLRSGRRLRTITGTLDELDALRGTTGDDVLKARVEGSATMGMGDQIRDWFPEAVDVEILDPEGPAGPVRTARDGSSPRELFEQFLTEEREAEPEVLALFDELLDDLYEPTPAGVGP
ncbi:MAG: exonuclease SbcCD subunit D [Actinomycetia bacterium]|nr:exonuclease SbcCD subunit D [Actinomycetes bacterium]MCP4087699.1 exonuclease SbcCD subunit D [Actinomycetes bacterium]